MVVVNLGVHRGGGSVHLVDKPWSEQMDQKDKIEFDGGSEKRFKKVRFEILSSGFEVSSGDSCFGAGGLENLGSGSTP